MKNLLKLALIFALMIAFVGCGSNDDDDDTPTPACSAADWVGVYAGPYSCTNLGGLSGTYDAIVSVSGSNVTITVKESDSDGDVFVDSYTASPEGCTFKFSEGNEDGDEQIEATLDGNKIIITQTFVGEGSCSPATITRTSTTVPALCPSSDWIGAYTGTKTCGSNTPEAITVDITEASFAGGLNFSIDLRSWAGAVPFGCEVPFFDSKATLNGDNLTIELDGGDCTVTATRD
ncbi:MAG: hypothetical protein AAGI38_08780 [Bacteroidota bacterium]